MQWEKPSRDEVLKAIDAYIAAAYPGAPPKAVQNRIEAIRTTTDDNLYEQEVFEVDATQPPAKYVLRLGNYAYPHMKMIIERAPVGNGHLFRADTHDEHVRPAPGTRDAELYSKLVIQNQQIADNIDAAWDKAGVPTFKALLREDLSRRRAGGGAG